MANKIECVTVLSMSEHDINIVANRVWVMHSTPLNLSTGEQRHSTTKKYTEKESNVCETKHTRKKWDEFELSKRLYLAVTRFSAHRKRRCAASAAEKQCSQWTCRRGNIHKVDACFSRGFFVCKQKKGKRRCFVFKMLSNTLDYELEKFDPQMD